MVSAPHPGAQPTQPNVFDFLPEHWSLTTLYLTCAAIGGAVVIVQLALSLFGFGGDDLDGDVGFDGDADGDMQFLSVRAIAGFLTMFGLAGWAGTTSGWSAPVTALVALFAGSTTFAVIGWLLSLQRKLDSSGNLDPKGAVGLTGRTYLRIPADNSGRGKVTIELQGRTAEFEAFTLGAELATGAQVRVVRMTSPGIFEVASVDA